MTEQHEEATNVPIEPTTDESARVPEQAAPDGGESANDVFPRKVVESLRREAAAARVKAKDADRLREELFRARVALDGRLADPTDLPYDEQLDQDGITAAIDALLESKPHMARRPRGDIGAGPRGGAGSVDLVSVIRNLQDRR